MKRILLIISLVIASIFLIGAVTYLDTAGIGVRIFPQEVAAIPAAPFVCAVAHRGKQVYVDDTNDTADAYLCFCGVDADDASYIWLKTENPAVDCF